jgi:endonuclease/exonuclease/phosphatase family metal-dependent hydrolase
MSQRGNRRVSTCVAMLIAMCTCMTVPGLAGAQTTVVLDAPLTESVDTAIQGGASANVNFNGKPLMTRASDNADYRRRSLLKFDTDGRVPAKAVIQSAKLTVTVKGGNTETRRLGAYQLVNSFDEATATWKVRSSGTAWVTSGGDLGAKYAEASVTGTPGSKVTFDVTRLVQEVVNSSGSRWTRVALVDLGASTNLSYREYYPSESSDPSVRPTLTVVYGGTSTAPAPAPTTSGSTSTLRLLHWNSHHAGQRTDGVYDTNGFVDWLVKMNPHVISLNEVDNLDQATRVATLLKSKTGVTWNWFYDDRGNQLLTKLSQPSESICVVNTSVGRKATHIGVVINGRSINVWSAHLDVYSGATRLAETTVLRTCEKGWAEARIAAGDFNMQPFTAEYYSMTVDHNDAWLAAPTKLNYPGNCDGCTRNSRIDFVFSSKGAASWLVLKSAQIFDTRNSSGVMASDHKPMLVTYEVR